MRPLLLGTRLLSLFSLLLTVTFALPAAAQTFAQPTVIPTGNWPAAIYTADVNGDGYPDLIYVDQGATPAASTTHVLLNDGKGHFTLAGTLSTAGDSIAFAPLGVGGVSVPSLLWVSSNASGFTINRANCASGSSCTPLPAIGPIPYPYPNANTPQFHYLTLARLRTNTGGQYSPEILLQDSANQILYELIFNPDGSNIVDSAALPDGAGPVVIVPGLSSTLPVTVIVNGLVNQTAQVYGKGTGLAQSNLPIVQPTSRIAGIHSLLIQDVNLDGRPDLIAEGTNGHIDVFPGNGDGTFSITSIGGTGPLDGLTGNGGHLIALADLNHDGQLDALTATPAGISTLFGAGTSYLKLGGIYNAGPGHTSYAVADFNGDDNLDLAVDSPEGIAILYGNPDGTFQSSRAYSAGAPALSAVLGALPADAPRDVVVATGGPQARPQAQLMIGAGDGTFAFQAGAATPDQPSPIGSVGEAGDWASVSVTDFNLDGVYDIALTADRPAAATNNALTPPGLSIFLGQGGRSFQPQPVTSATEPASSGPFYGVSIPGPPIFPLSNLDSQSLQAFRTVGQSGAILPASLIVPEQDLHAHNLLASLRTRNQDASYLLMVQDQGSLKLIDAAHSSIKGDLAVDGSITTAGQMVAPDISATFPGPSRALGFTAFPGSMIVAKLAGDSLGDLIVVYDNLDADRTNPTAAKPNYLYIWYASGGGKFLTSAKHPVNPVRIQLSRNYYQVAVADLNNDGIPDLILSDGYLISYQLGLGDGTFGPEHHLLAGRGINTISTADLRGLGTQDLIIANGGATFSNPVINHEVLIADPDVNTGGITVLLNTVTPKAALSSTLAASPEPSVYFSPYTITATLTGSPTPTGAVTFSEDGTALGTATTTTGVYTIAGAILLPGTHTLTATYSEVPNYPASTLTPGTHTITRSPSTVYLTPTTPLTVYYGQGIDGTFSLSVVDPTHPADGNYTLLDNGAPVAICTNIPYNQLCPYGNPVLLDAGPHTLSIQYLGDAVNAPGLSPNYPYVIVPDLTTVTLISSNNPAIRGDAVTFTATVSGNIVPPSGAVNFLDNGTLLGSGTLSAGPGLASTLTFTTSSLAVGTHPITAVYLGNANFNAATSAILNQIIHPVSLGSVASSTTLSSNLNPSAPQQLVTFTANVAVPGVFVTIPVGTVTFLDGSAPIGTATLNNFGVATFQTAALVTGTHAITASYAGFTSTTAPVILPSVSPVLSQVVTIPLITPAAGFEMTVNPNALTLGVGRTGILAVNILAVGGFNQPVQLSCANLAPETSCQFSPSATVPPGGGSVTLQLLTSAPRDCNTNTPYSLSTNTTPKWPLAPGIAAAALLWVALRRRRVQGFFLFLAAATALMTLSGCGHCTDLGTRPGSYTFQITATAQGGPVSQTRTASIPLTINIQQN